MKKKKFLCVFLAAAFVLSLFSCSNSSGGGGDSGSGRTGDQQVGGGDSGSGGTGDQQVGGGDSGSEGTGDQQDGGGQNLTFTGTSYTELDAATGGTMGTSATYAYFGDWPQSAKADGVTVDETKSVVQGAYTYYKGSDDAWYAKLSGSYYKVEPIKWCVLDSSKKLLLAESILINSKYYDYYNVNRTVDGKVIYPNNYEHSRIRAYLNGLSYQKKESDAATQENDSSLLSKGFLQTAFTSTLQSKIATTSVVNNARSTNPDGDGNANLWNSGNNQYASDTPTSDKIFLLSEQEVTKADYGFAAYNEYKGDGKHNDSTRIRMTTDFAKASGAYQSSTVESGGVWWLRSPSFSLSDVVLLVGSVGYADDTHYVGDVDIDVVPALCLK